MMRHNIIVAAAVVALTGCSDDLEPDLAACKAKAMEAYKPAHLSEEQPAAYLRECMTQAFHWVTDRQRLHAATIKSRYARHTHVRTVRT
jgi:hypothetical protein